MKLKNQKPELVKFSVSVNIILNHNIKKSIPNDQTFAFLEQCGRFEVFLELGL